MASFSDVRGDATARRLVYTAAVTLVVVPMFQALAQLWPLQPDSIQWRFGTANALSSVLLLPFLGLLLLAMMSRAMESRGLARLVGVVATTFVLGLGASLAVFVLDAVQLRTVVNPQMSAQFMNTSVRVGGVTVFFACAFLMVAILSFTRFPNEARKGTSGGDSDVLLVGVRTHRNAAAAPTAPAAVAERASQPHVATGAPAATD